MSAWQAHRLIHELTLDDMDRPGWPQGYVDHTVPWVVWVLLPQSSVFFVSRTANRKGMRGHEVMMIRSHLICCQGDGGSEFVGDH